MALRTPLLSSDIVKEAKSRKQLQVASTMGTLQGLCILSGDILNLLPALREAPIVAGMSTFLTTKTASVISPYPHYLGQDTSLLTFFSLTSGKRPYCLLSNDYETPSFPPCTEWSKYHHKILTLCAVIKFCTYFPFEELTQSTIVQKLQMNCQLCY